MKVVFEFESEEERQDFLTTLSRLKPGGEAPTKEEFQIIEEQVTQKIMSSLGQDYMTGMRLRNMKDGMDFRRLKKFNGNQLSAEDSKAVEASRAARSERRVKK